MINNKYFEKMITRENDDDIVSTNETLFIKIEIFYG